MKRDIATQWVQALRSGEYQQGKKCLRANDAFCCLGVLCDLHRQAEGGEWSPGLKDPESPAGRQEYHATNGDWDHSLLPEAVQEWAGMRSPNPSVRGDPVYWLNDTGGRDFSDLADIIETCSEDL